MCLAGRAVLALTLALTLGVARPEALTARQGSGGADTGTRGDPLTVFLVTAAPGDAVWERFGHNGIWIRDEARGEDRFWEWGLFSFRQEGFLARLARGTMRYWMGGRPLDDMLSVYRAQGRAVWAQELALTPAQERALDAFVRTNALPENAQYVYHYYLDNCSTRARDALDRVLEGALERAFAGQSTGVTWRWHTRRLLRDAPLAEAGVQVVLGNPGDREITAWEEMFLPMRMRAHLATVRIPGPDGALRPLVAHEVQLLESRRPPEPAAPAARVLPVLALGLLAGLVVAGLAGWGAAGSRTAIRLLGGAVLAWSLMAGLLGLVLVVAWALTDHDFWRWNENLLQLSPLSLAAAALAFPLLAGRQPGRALVRVLTAVAWLSAGALLLKLLPGLGQQNWEVVAVALPLHFAAAWGARRLARPSG
ncbi:MAG: DUF4105 domain-containing protein [Longimicrobiales bacterium]|nr:DUF4105 domain-containing protein [Longimicrobiales bacterium]